MITRLTLNHWQDWLVPGSPDDTRLLHADKSDRVRVCPPHLGQGYSHEIPLRDDLSVVVLDYTLDRDLILDAAGDGSGLELSFHLASRTPGYSFFCPNYGWRSLGLIPAQQRFFKVKLRLKQLDLSSYYQLFLERLTPQAHAILEDIFQNICHAQSYGSKAALAEILAQLQAQSVRSPNLSQSENWLLPSQVRHQLSQKTIEINYAVRRPITPKMEQTIWQILDCPYRGQTRRTYLERLVSHLLTLHFNAATESALSTADLDCIYRAAEILRAQFVTPPSIDALSRQAGVNRLKLNQGFHQVYGTTPFGYLRECRLSQAQQLLMTSELSTSEVAKVVGYSCRSKFAAAFRKYIGINPKAFQMNAWMLAS